MGLLVSVVVATAVIVIGVIVDGPSNWLYCKHQIARLIWSWFCITGISYAGSYFSCNLASWAMTELKPPPADPPRSPTEPPHSPTGSPRSPPEPVVEAPPPVVEPRRPVVEAPRPVVAPRRPAPLPLCRICGYTHAGCGDRNRH